MNNTLHILVTCSRDVTRDEIAGKVVESLKSVPLECLMAFDNASVYSHTLHYLMHKVDYVNIAKKNFGYWSAIKWCLDNHERILGRTFDYVYVIESDMVHYAYPRLSVAEKFLDHNPDIGSVRLQEFSVEESALYDKNFPRPDSRRYAWTRLSNHFTGAKAYFHDQEGSIARTNLAPQVCALNRMSFMREAFDELAKFESLAEVDFQKEYFKRFEETALLDGGIFNTKLSYDSEVMTGSYSTPEAQQEVGYRTTRVDKIEKIEDADVLSMNTAVGRVMVVS